MVDQHRSMRPSGQRRVLKLITMLCCVCMAAALSSVVLQVENAGATPTIWSTAPTPNPNGQLIDISCVSSTSCVAVGWAYSDQTLIESWDGTSWSIMPSPNFERSPKLSQ